jgi:hypothetical protein
VIISIKRAVLQSKKPRSSGFFKFLFTGFSVRKSRGLIPMERTPETT